MNDFIAGIPKAELHLHIEGTLEPELLLTLAERNKIQLPYKSESDVKKAYQFADLQSFLDIYYQGASVLIEEQDFYDLTWAYLCKAHQENLQHVEIFFDPQTHTSRDIKFEVVINGITAALKQAEKQYHISSCLILCFLRHLPEAEAFNTLNQALFYKDQIIAVGLDSSEKGNPPEKFVNVFEQARKAGFLTVAHAGEEGPADYIWQALNLLKVSRIDHGIRCDEDKSLMKKLATDQVPLTLCPLSNVKLRVFNTMAEHNFKKLLDANLCVTVNSDDPAYFGGYITANMQAIATSFNLNKQHIYQLTKNAFNASFAGEERKQVLLQSLHDYMSLHC
ncbi:MAG: adenosine deaminase [Gammaproteobacteria bacterium]|nr:adenosine deaminase [Gammaproteobacteria bacterium]